MEEDERPQSPELFDCSAGVAGATADLGDCIRSHRLHGVRRFAAVRADQPDKWWKRAEAADGVLILWVTARELGELVAAEEARRSGGSRVLCNARIRELLALALRRLERFLASRGAHTARD